MSEKFTMWCSPRPFRVPNDLPCHRETVGRLEVIEYLTADTATPYALQLEAQVASHNDLGICRGQALGLAKELDRAWPYAAGVGLFPPMTSIHVSSMPFGWSSNANQLEAVLPGATLKITAGPQVSAFLVNLAYMPLKPALDVLRALREADEMTLALVRLHFEALASPRSDSGLFLFAKSLELVAALLPGRKAKHKQAALGAEYVQDLRHSMEWLQRIANTRLDLRHAVASSDHTTALHPKLTAAERRDFLHDADCVVRAALRLRLQIETPTVRRKG